MVALQRRDDGTKHGQRTNTIKEDGGAEAVGQTHLASRTGTAVDQTLETTVDVEPRADNPTNGKGDDEEDGVLALAEIGDGGVETDSQGGEAKGGIEHGLVLLADAAVQPGTKQGADYNGSGIDNGSYHGACWCVCDGDGVKKTAQKYAFLRKQQKRICKMCNFAE